ncbi:MAG: hypothetical protein C0424_08880 [Sphingobacteriaceae bacterium]|nr:hypothetical protein [Sphingobacteriaceae bacterium]
MKYFFFTALLWLSFVSTQAQLTQLQRTEIEISENGTDNQLAMGTYGILLFGGINSESKLNYEVTRYDTTFKKVGSKQFEIPAKAGLVDRLVSSDGQTLHLLFQRKKNLTVYSYNVVDGSLKVLGVKLVNSNPLEAAALLGKHLYVWTQMKKMPLLSMINLSNGRNTAMVLPMQTPMANIKSMVANNEKGMLTVAVQGGYSKKNVRKTHFEIFFFNEGKSQPTSSMPLQNEEGKSTVDALVTWQGTESFLVTGTYSLDKDALANGLYLALYEQGKQRWIRYHNFADMGNFFTYLNKKKQVKAEKAVQKKKAKGKEDPIEVLMSSHEVERLANQYVLVAERYYPTYRTVTHTYMVNGQMQTQNFVVFDGYAYSHAVALGLDERGNKLWDHCFELENLGKSYSVVHHVKKLTRKNEIRLFYPATTNFKAMRITGDAGISSRDLGSIAPENPEIKVKWSADLNAQYWYGDFVLVSGLQRIKEDEGRKKRRTIFFLSKVQLNTDLSFEGKGE